MVPGAGVVLFSDASALGEEAGTGAVAEAAMGVETVDGVDFTLEVFLGVGFGRNRLSCVGEILKTTVLVGLLILSGRGC